MKRRVLALLVLLCLLVSAFATTASAIVSQKPVLKESGTVEGKEDAFPAIQSALTQYQVGETKTYTDEYIGIPYAVTVYNDAEAKPVAKPVSELDFLYETSEPNPYNLSADGKPVVYYVINTNTERVGTDSDVSIITGLLAEGYVVLVVDYKNEKRAATPDLDWSLQKVRTHTTEFTSGITVWKDYNYVVPAGYTIRRGVQYFNYVESGVDGILECIMEIWNIDLKRTSGDYNRGNKWSVIWGQKELVDGTLVYQDAEGNRCIKQGEGYVYYTQNADYSYTVGEAVADPSGVTPLYKKVSDDIVWEDEAARKCKIRYAIAEDWWDLTKANGERVDMNLYLDITYPTNPGYEVPVMMLASSSELRSSATQTATRPISTGFMFQGYAFVNYDHAYTPMARDDHYGYFEGESPIGRRNGFSVNDKVGVESQTAAVRCVRALGEMYDEISIAQDKFGAWGHSKGASVNRLGTAHPELQVNDAYVSGHRGECSGTQPWLTYTDGTAIPSNVQLVYASNGGGTYHTFPDAPPTVVTQGEVDGDFTSSSHYGVMLHTLRSNNTPALDMSMEGVGHTTIYGYNEERDYDMYQALFDFCNYYLKDEASVCEYILPKSGTVNVGITDDIIVKFTGPIPEREIVDKVKVRNTRTGELVAGVWTSAFSGNEWTFSPFHLEGGTVYTVEVASDVIGENNKAIKNGKTVAFRTAYESQFGAAEVTSTNGSLTLFKTEEGANGVYFIFNPLTVDHNLGTTLRFSVTNKASTLLRVWGVTALADNRADSTLTAQPIGDVGVAGNEIVEIDVTEYLASLADGEVPAFYVETVKMAGTTTTFDYSLDDKNNQPSIVSLHSPSGFDTTPNGTRGFKAVVGHFISWSLPTLTESDYGRFITITFDMYSDIERSLHAFVTMANNKQDENGKFYMDYYNDAYTNVLLKAGEWQTITLTYFIDNEDYVKDSVQKRKIYIEFSGENLSNKYAYLDNIKITETVVDATVGACDTANSIAPMLAVKTAVEDTVPVLNAGYVVSGEDADKSFDGENGYLVSGLTEGVPGSRLAMVYAKVDLRTVKSGMPYVLSLSAISGSGKLEIYGIADTALCEDLDVASLNYLNAPGFDRTVSSVDKTLVWGGDMLGTLDIYGSGDYQLSVTDYVLAMKAKGATFAVIVIMAEAGTEDEIVFDFTPSSKTTIHSTVNALNFDKQTSFELETYRGETLYDVSDVFMQGDSATQRTYENNGISASSTIRKGSSGQSVRVQAPDSGYNVYKFLKLTDTNDRVFTAADIGKTYTVTFSLYLEQASGKTPTMGLASVGYNATGDGTDASKMHQGVRLTNLKVGEWNEITYTFTVDEVMTTGRVGASGTSMETDFRPVHFAIFGMRNTVFYIDDLTLQQTYSYDPASFESTMYVSNDFEGKSGMDSNGFEWIDNGDGTRTHRVQFVNEENTTFGGSTSVRVLANKDYNRIYPRNLFTLTEDNVGDTFTVTFKMKSDRASYMEVMVGNPSYTAGTAYDGMPAKATVSISADEVGKWVSRSYTFTVTEGLVATGYTGLRFNLSGFGKSNSTLYFDDFVCKREVGTGGIMLSVGASTDTPDNYLVNMLDFETAPSITPNGFEKMTLEDGSQILRYGVSSEENTTRGGSYSYKIQHNKAYNRLFFNNFFPIEYLTDENIGDVYTIMFKAKVSRAGTFYLSPAMPPSDTSNSYDGMPTMGTFKFTEEQVGQWVDCVYTVTVTEGMLHNAPIKTEKIDGVTTITEWGTATSLRINFNGGFGKQETSIYLDDMAVYRNLPDNVSFASGETTKVIVSDTLCEQELFVKTPSEPSGIHKTFFSFDISDYRYAHGAMLAFTANAHQGQTFKLWALEGTTLPEELTYNNVDANELGEGILEQYAFGGAPVALFTFDESGKALVDVSAYVKRHLGETVTFAVTADDGSMKYLDIDFSLAKPVLGSDVTSDGTLAIVGGALTTDGTVITLYNAFGAGQTVLPALEPITVTVNVSAQSTKTYTVTVDGTAYSYTGTPTDGKLVFTFIPTEDVSVSSISISAQSAGLAIGEIEILSECIANLKAPALKMYKPTTPVYDFDGVIAGHNVVISESLTYNLYLAMDKGIASLELGGVSFDFASLPTVTVNGTVYKRFAVDAVAKDAFRFKNVRIVLEDGNFADYDIGVRNYLAQFLKMAESDEAYSLAANMLSYLAASVAYFYEDDAAAVAGANAVTDALLGKNYDAENPSTALNTTPAVKNVDDSGMMGAGMNLAERPTFYFIAAEGYESEAPVFTLGEDEITYEREEIEGKVYYLLAISPIELTKTVCWSIGDKSGAFNLRAYYDWAKDVAEDDALTHLVERLFAYAESVQNYFN